jgi:hypothetical protein
MKPEFDICYIDLIYIALHSIGKHTLFAFTAAWRMRRRSRGLQAAVYREELEGNEAGKHHNGTRRTCQF